MKSSKDRIPLKAFFEEVEGRLRDLPADELRSVLLEMARQVSPAERGRFLKQLQPQAPDRALVEQEAGTDALLDDIGDLKRSLSEEMEEVSEQDDRYEDYDDESGFGYEDFGENLEELFDRAQAAFDLGRLSVARDAYGELFEILGEEDDYGRTVAPPDGVDLADARARYLHALCATAPPSDRAARLLEAFRDWEHLSDVSGSATVEEVFRIGSFFSPDRTAILTTLIDLLQETDDLAGDRWLRQATCLLHGRQGIEKLARLEGHRRPHAYLDWLARVADEQTPEDLADAAQVALEALPAGLPLRALAADRLHEAAVALRDSKMALAARWESFQAEPTLMRLLDLWDAAGEWPARQEWARRAASIAAERKPPPNPITDEESLLLETGFTGTSNGGVTSVCALLLSGDWDEAREVAAKDPELGWSGGESAQAIVLPFLLVYVSLLPPGSLPPNLRTLWQEAMERLFRWRDDASAGGKRLSEALAMVMGAATPSPVDVAKLVEWCITVAMKRVNAIADGAHRGAYERAATLAVAVSEVLRARGEPLRGDRLVRNLLERHNRKPAFKRAIQACLRATSRA